MISFWIEALCARCNRTTSGRFSLGALIPVKKMKAEILAEGWVIVDDETFCCRAHADEYLEERK